MSGEAVFYLVTVSGGTVVDKQNTLQDKNASGSKSQQWTVEYGSDPNQVAFQNAANGQWLRAFSGAAYGKIDTGEKQWWTLSDGAAPGSKWIKCNDFPDAYLCNANGSYVDNNKVYSWPKQLNWTHALTWHIKDVNAPGFPPKATTAAASSDNTEELKRKEADLAEREKKLKEIEAREAAVADKENKLKDLDGREAALAEKEKQAKEVEKREQSLGAKEQELAAKEAAQKKQADQLAAQEKELASKASQPKGKSDDNLAEQAALQKKLDELKAAEQALASREAAATKKEQLATAKDKELKSKQAELEKKLRGAAGNSANAEALLKAENDNLKLQLKLKDLEKELEAAKRAAAAKSNDAKLEDDAQLKRLKDENARLKKLVAQQVLKTPPKPAQTNGTNSANGDHSASKPSQAAASTGNHKVDTSKPTANSGRPVVPAHKAGGHPSTKPASQPSGTSAGPKRSPAEDAELAKLREENARLKQQMTDAKEPNDKSAHPSAGHSGTSKPSVTSTSPAGKPVTGSKPAGSAPNGTTVTPTASGSFGEDPELTKAREENARLKQQTADAKKPPFKPAGSSAPSTADSSVPNSGLEPANVTSGKHTPSKPGKSSGGTPNGGLAAGGRGDPKNFVKGHTQPSSVNGSQANKSAPKPALKPGNSGANKPALASKTPGQKQPNGSASKKPLKSGTGTPAAANGAGDAHQSAPQKFDCGHVVYPPPRKVGMRAVGYVYE